MPQIGEPFSTAEWEAILGKNISKMRRTRNLTQKDLAKTTGLSVSAIKKIEGGQGSSMRSLILIARALGRTDWLSSFLSAEPEISPLELLRRELQKPINKNFLKEANRVSQ